MSALSDYLENALINHIFGNADFARPANIYLALYTSDPSDADGGTEVNGGSYARQPVPTGASSEWAAANSGATSNNNTITFPTATANWGDISHVGLRDALSGGNLLMHGALAESKTINNGDIFRFNAGDIDVSLD